MKAKIIFLIFTSIILYSCSTNEDAKSAQFEFLEFEKDVVLPSINSGDISFLAIDFDQNLANWEITLTDDNGATVPAVLDRVESTIISFSDKNIQRVVFKAAPKENGVYTLQIKNKTTNQMYSDHFLVKSKTFNEITYPYAEDYTVLFAYNSDQQEPTQDYFYFQTIKNTIKSDIISSGIVGVRLEETTTFQQYNLDYTINTQTNKVEFVIPTGVPSGKYYFSVQYNSLTSAYFEKDIIVQEGKKPILTSINKAVFNGGEIMTLNGSDFRIQFDLELVPGSKHRNQKGQSSLIFTDKYGSGAIDLSAYESDPSYNYMNAQNTVINFPIPRNTSSDDFFFVSVNDGSYFEGTVAVRSGPFISEAIPVRVNLK